MCWTVTIPPRSISQRQPAPDQPLSNTIYKDGYAPSPQPKKLLQTYTTPEIHCLLIAVDDFVFYFTEKIET